MLKNKERFPNILFFFFICIIMFCINYFLTQHENDLILGYGFSYNITNGLLPYVDYNMIVLPFYNLFMAFFMIIFGNSMLSFYIISSFLFSSVLFLLSKKIGKLQTIILALYSFFLLTPYGYNVFCALGVMLILYIEESEDKYKDLFIGLIIGSIMMTKANIGALLFLVFFFKSKNKLKSFLYCAIIPFFILLYLIFTNSLLQCIEYCFLGMNNFMDNFYYYDVISIIMCILPLVFLVYKLMKTKDKNYLYLIAFMSLCFPIINYNHAFIAIYPIVYYIFDKYKNSYLKLTVKALIIVFTIAHLSVSKFQIYKQINIDNIKKEYGEYIEKNKDKTFFFFDYLSYKVKISLNIPITKYDLLNRGNMGRDDLKFLKEIKEICRKEECRIFAKPDHFSIQIPKEYLDYLHNYYELCYSDYIYCERKLFCRDKEDK